MSVFRHWRISARGGLAPLGLALFLPFLGAWGQAAVRPDVLQSIEAALPTAAPAAPRRPRRLLIYDANVGYGGHGSIPVANEAFTRMGERTGAFATTVSRDPEAFRPESLARFDAVFFNNTVGNLFEVPELRQSLVEFVYGGGGLLGIHGASVAFTRWPGAHEDWPEFGRMLGARGASHQAADERVLVRLEDPPHPLCLPFGGKDFEYADEFFRFHGPYSRHRVRVLLSIDNARSASLQGVERIKRFREDDDYALAWVRSYGKGRVCYSAIGHNPRIFWDPAMLSFYLAAAQFALGDLPAPTTPSARLTPAVRAWEKLGWRLGIEAYTFHKFTFFETIDKTAELGLPYIGGLNFQKVSAEIPRNLDPQLGDEDIAQIRRKLDEAGVQLLTYYYQNIPGDEEGCRRVFEFGRKLGIETFMAEPDPKALDTIERFCDRYDIKVALHNHGPKSSPLYWRPEGILEACQGRSPRIGACIDLGYWMRSGVDPVAAIRLLKDRVITVQMHDLNEVTPEGHDVPWGTGAGRSGDVFRELHRLGIQPVMIGLEYSYDWLDNMPEAAECIQFFNTVAAELAESPQP
ncbi:MAG: ThuA domain-containing protein [Lentisphaeria bacterium]|nr:ThuA domain-containing protein [Lentisphaeria bacterium]